MMNSSSVNNTEKLTADINASHTDTDPLRRRLT